jgi:phage terminase Nu1 subunit (DNA packaging protein)
MNDGWMTCGDLAALFGMTGAGVSYWRKKGMPTRGKVANAYLVDADEALQWIAENSAPRRAEALDLLGRTDEEVAA